MARRQSASVAASVLMIGLILVLRAGAAHPSAQAAAAPPRIAQDIRDRVARDGRVRLIVELKLSTAHVPEAALPSAADVLSQRERIGTQRARLFERLPRGAQRELRRFVTVPFTVIDATAATLDALDQLGDEIASVRVDAIHRPVLAESVPLIEADQVWAN